MEQGIVPNSRSGECTALQEIQFVTMYENGIHACTEARCSHPVNITEENNH